MEDLHIILDFLNAISFHTSQGLNAHYLHVSGCKPVNLPPEY